MNERYAILYCFFYNQLIKWVGYIALFSHLFLKYALTVPSFPIPGWYIGLICIFPSNFQVSEK